MRCTRQRAVISWTLQLPSLLGEDLASLCPVAAQAAACRHFSNLGYDSRRDSVKTLRDSTFLVTGSTDGIGLHTAELLSQSGAIVFLHGRSLQKVKKTVKQLRTHTHNPSIYGYCADLSTIEGTRNLANHISRDLERFFHGRLNCLINNAGVFMEEKEITADNLEMTWAVNTVSPFLLTHMLLPYLSDLGRIINCSSISLADTIDLSKIQQDAEYEREGHAAYGVSKLALNMWSYYLSRKLEHSGRQLVIHCVDPGTVSTKLLYAGWGEVSHVALLVEEADDEFWAATAPELQNTTGNYYVNRKARKSPEISYDSQIQKQLVALLEKQTGIASSFGCTI
jgi:NAD(P)-dependent dehydrogenase (short-subunit alcohol dehydrogenase family)